MENVPNTTTNRRRRSTYAIICILSLLGGIEYAVILPTLYPHLEETYHAPSYFQGLVLSAFSFSGLFFAPLMGRIYDKTRNAKILISFTNLFNIIGSVIYWIGINEWYLLIGRLIAGLSVGYFSIVLAEVSLGSSNENRTSIVSAVMATRQLGLLIGPAFNLFLSKLNFYIGPFIVDKYSSPGLLMAILWLVGQCLHMILYHRLSPPMQVADLASNDNQSINNSPKAKVSLKDSVLGILYDEYMVIFFLTFIALFNQTGIEALLTPLSNMYLGWQEIAISLVFLAAGVVILTSFALVHFASKRFKDRPLILFGLLCQIFALAWLFWLPNIQQNPDRHTINAALLVIAMAIDVFGLPFLFVCHVSLFSKILPKDIQGFGHGCRRTVAGIASILGPLWTGSLVNSPYVMVPVMVSVNLLALVLMMLSYKSLQPPAVDIQLKEQMINEEPTERSPLLGD